ncbi:hypothetical protein Kpol_1062p6 [Vanderwaltozyma polyspora DSM 70294]|uniref:Uncharacterized protein n=1 Tax=Vanderwaltozyma polyspora (strain ATCC 22028 / DSM 70294 / BCRC 21397 / CBS 2163 / NBRC 10782 / NRRL Y-8283 / UCD 57-17) TaxID=436907 RepID=A7TK64_VANPO|nr:uncharacterized protein Kpol_1062p6 [Vanderwaltozyma polyspora DSM 70294]EDO17299.1 hypothetical protein Kpol_1062p6 [Vanderwaltozyma polyspora DSM 70294]
MDLLSDSLLDKRGKLLDSLLAGKKVSISKKSIEPDSLEKKQVREAVLILLRLGYEFHSIVEEGDINANFLEDVYKDMRLKIPYKVDSGRDTEEKLNEVRASSDNVREIENSSSKDDSPMVVAGNIPEEESKLVKEIKLLFLRERVSLSKILQLNKNGEYGNRPLTDTEINELKKLANITQNYTNEIISNLIESHNSNEVKGNTSASHT